jgi:hypothetical protein
MSSNAEREGRPGLLRIVSGLDRIVKGCTARAGERPELAAIATTAGASLERLRLAEERRIRTLAEYKAASTAVYAAHGDEKRTLQQLGALLFGLYGHNQPALAAFGVRPPGSKSDTRVESQPVATQENHP